MRTFLLLLGAVALASASQVTYDNYSVVRLTFTPSSETWVRGVVRALQLPVWSEGPGRKDVLCAPDVTQRIVDVATKRGTTATVIIENVQKLIDEQRASIKHHVKKTDRAVDSSTYRDYSQLMLELDGLESDFPGLISSYSAGTTYEGRGLRVAKVSSGGSDSRPVVWIDCGIHAREWVSQASCMYFLDQLTSGYGSDATVTALLDNYDFHILPVTNPDGYVYSWDQDRLWRKNRVPYGLCFGTDCNRNFDSNFGGEGSSDAACADTYHGPAAFSEAESTAIRDSSEALGGRLKAVFTIHSYSQYWMTPYGYTSNLPSDYTEMKRVADIGVAALEAVYGTQFVDGNIADVIYVASGGSVDWTYDALGVVYSYALELRDTGTFGFLLPERQIEPTAEETWAGITAAVNAFS